MTRGLTLDSSHDLLLHTQCLLSTLPAAKHFVFLLDILESISVTKSLIYGSQRHIHLSGIELGTSY